MLAMRTFVIIQNEIKEDAKLENQIQLLKQRLAQEKSARLALEQAAKATSAILVTSTATSAYSGLEDADLVIEMLRKENTALKEANRTLKVSNVQLKKEKDVMERGAYVNGASFAAANHRASKLQEDLELLKGAHQKIKLTHRLLKQQNMSMMEKNTLLHQQFQEKTQEITNVIREKQAITHELDKMNKENAALAKANARLRLILRQDADLSRKHRDELPNLTKVAYSIKHGSTAVVDIAVDSASNAPAATNVVASTPAALSIIEKPILGMTIKKMTHGAPQAKPVYSETANYTMVNFSTLEPSTNAHIAGTSTPATGSPDSITPIGRALQLEGFKKAQGEAAKTARVVNVVPKSEEGNVSDNNELATATHTSSLGNKILRVRMEERNGATNNSSDIIRQPVGSDGPIIDTEKVMGLIDDEKENIEDTNARVRFHVTLNIDPEEEKLKQEKHLKQTHQTFFNSTKDCKGKTNANNGAAYRTRGGRRGSYDGGQRAYRGSYDGDERTHRDSLTENLMGGHGGRTRRGSYDKNYNAGAPKFNNKHPRKRGSGGKKIEL
jgi:myosin-5